MNVGAVSVLAAVACAGSLAAARAAQSRGFASGGGGMSTSRVASPAVVASWTSQDSLADGSHTTLLVLWRGSPGWFSQGGRGGGGGTSSSGGAGGNASLTYQYFSQGGLTFTMQFDRDKHAVRLLNQEISLEETNVVLVDFVDGPNGPAIVGTRWIEPGPPAPPVLPGAMADPVAGVIRRSQELYDYLRCDLSLPDPAMNAMVATVCGLMRPVPAR